MSILENTIGYPSNWVHQADPRVKMLFVVASWLVLLTNRNPVILFGYLGFLHLLTLSARIPWRSTLSIWKALLPLVILIPTLWGFFYTSGTPLWAWGWIQFSPSGFLLGLYQALRLVALALVVFIWLYTTEANSLVLGLVKLKIPYEWGLVVTITLQYIPSFRSLYRMISEAQQARGLVIEGSGIQRARKMMPILVALVISILRKSDQISRALESRAFGVSGTKRTYLHSIRFRPTDYLYAGVIVLSAVSLILVNIYNVT